MQIAFAVQPTDVVQERDGIFRHPACAVREHHHR